MKKTRKKLTLNRDTLRGLTLPALDQAAGNGTYTCQVNGSNTCTIVVTCPVCATATCPTNCGQWYCYGTIQGC